jgi:hypothetical protein
MKGSPGAAVKLLLCDHEVVGSCLENGLLQKYRKNVVYIRPKAIGSFPEPYTSGSYVQWAALLMK